MAKIILTIEDTPDGGITVEESWDPPMFEINGKRQPKTTAEILVSGFLNVVENSACKVEILQQTATGGGIAIYLGGGSDVEH